MSLDKQGKLQKDNAIAEKYLKFLMEAYIILSKGYAPFKIGIALKRHNVDKHAFTAVVKLGWITKLPSEKTGIKYFWRGPIPTIEHTDQVRKQLSTIKSTAKTNLAIKFHVPLSPSGKKLIPVVKSEQPLSQTVPRLHQGAEERYLNMMTDLYLELSDGFKRFSLGDVGKKYRVAKTAAKMLLKLNYIERQSDSLCNYRWIGAVPTPNEARLLLQKASQHNTQYVKHLKSRGKETPKTEQSPIVIAKVEKVAKVVENNLSAPIITPTPSTEKDLSKDFAMKLFALGALKEANEVLDTLLTKK